MARRGDRPERDRREELPADVEVCVEPAPEAVKALARHIRGTGRAYAMADVARMILQARDRYQLRFRKSQGEGESEPFYRCDADGSLWLTRDEAVAHVLRSPVLKQFYSVEEIEVDPPKGNFGVIAVCGMSGKTLGPPNHHEYPLNVARLHRERFSGMSLERYKSRIEMHRDEETLEKWKAEVSRKRVYRVGPADEEDSAEPAGEEGEPEEEAESPATNEGEGQPGCRARRCGRG